MKYLLAILASASVLMAGDLLMHIHLKKRVSSRITNVKNIFHNWQHSSLKETLR